MKNSRLIKVLRTFNKKEFKQFGKFVSSPFFSTGRNVVPLFDALKKFYPVFDGDGFSRENMLNELSRCGYKVSYPQLKMQMTELYKMSEQFLTFQSGKSEPGLNAYFFARSCRKRGLHRLGESKISASIKKIEKNGIDGSFYLNYYFGKVEMINFFFMKDKPLKGVQTLNHLSEILLHNFLCNISRYIYNLVVLESGLNINTGDNLLVSFINLINYEKLLECLERRNDVYSNASCIYILYIMMLLNPAVDVYYFKFKEKLFKNISVFSFYEQSGFMQNINFRAEQLMKGINYNKFANEEFEIINFRLHNNLYKQEPSADYTTNEFHSAFYIGFVLRKKAWLKNFMKKYINEIIPEQRDNSLLAAQAFIAFLDRDYIKCLKNINNLKNMLIITEFDIKRLQLMAIYEAGHINEAYYVFDAFKAFLRKNKNVSQRYFESNNNFIKFYRIILKQKYEEADSNLKKLRLEAQNSNAASQEWIIEKIDEMIPAFKQKIQ